VGFDDDDDDDEIFGVFVDDDSICRCEDRPLDLDDESLWETAVFDVVLGGVTGADTTELPTRVGGIQGESLRGDSRSPSVPALARTRDLGRFCWSPASLPTTVPPPVRCWCLCCNLLPSSMASSLATYAGFSGATTFFASLLASFFREKIFETTLLALL
jgi:hypothetical protein